MATLAVDWDGTLVDPEQQWLPYAQEALRAFLQDGHKIIIHSCRANWAEGLGQIQHKLSAAHLAIDVWDQPGKPDADLYLDDRGVFFGGDWPQMVQMVKTATFDTEPTLRPLPARKRAKPRRQPGRMWS